MVVYCSVQTGYWCGTATVSAVHGSECHHVSPHLHKVPHALTCHTPHRYYSTSIFCQIGVSGYVSTAVVGTINFLTTFLSIVLVDKVCTCTYYKPNTFFETSTL